jgi:hypothetical protein
MFKSCFQTISYVFIYALLVCIIDVLFLIIKKSCCVLSDSHLMVWDRLRNSGICQILNSQVTRCLDDVYVLLLKVSINIIILKKKKN